MTIPAELKQRRQWVVWAYEERKGKKTKVPYTPGTTSKAMPNKAATWRTYDEAVTCYEQNSQFFAGVGYMFAADDPYVGGDIDHCIVDGVLSDEARALLPDTYAEISPSGCGLKFIGRATGFYGRHVAKGELYSERRFFTITGNVLPGHEHIKECQTQIDVFLAALGTAIRVVRDGTAGKGSRAETAAKIPPELWQAGREQRLTNINRLLSQLRASSISKKTRKPDTMLAYILREDYRGFHEKWPHVGIVRGDGSIDSSQIRCVMADSIRGRGFSFPEYAALMSYFFSAECTAKWGTKQGVREEIASLWFYSRSPRTVTPFVPEPTKRGRGSDHGELLERAYTMLLTFKVGVDSILTIGDLAESMNVSPRSAAGLMAELVASGQITKRRYGSHGGLVVSFPDMQNEEIKSGDIPIHNPLNGHSAEPLIDATLIQAPDMHNAPAICPIPMPETTVPTHIDQCETPPTPDMHNDKDGENEVGALECGEIAAPPTSQDRDATSPLIVYIADLVSLPAEPCMSRNRVRLKDAVTDALDLLPKDKADPDTGLMKGWPRTLRRVIQFVQYEYADEGWTAKAIERVYTALRKQRKNQEFADLKEMPRDALEKKHAGFVKRIARAERLALAHPVVDARGHYDTLARKARGQAAKFAWELSRRDEADKTRIEQHGYSEGEQSEMLELVEQVRVEKPQRKLIPAPNPVQTSLDIGAMIDRMKVARTA